MTMLSPLPCTLQAVPVAARLGSWRLAEHVEVVMTMLSPLPCTLQAVPVAARLPRRGPGAAGHAAHAAPPHAGAGAAVPAVVGGGAAAGAGGVGW